MQAFGDKALPVLVIDGEITAHGHYPGREELASLLTQGAASAAAVTTKSQGCGCSPGSGC